MGCDRIRPTQTTTRYGLPVRCGGWEHIRFSAFPLVITTRSGRVVLPVAMSRFVGILLCLGSIRLEGAA